MATVATTCAVRRNLQNRRHRLMVRERSFRPLMDTACPSQWPMYPDTGNTYGYSEGISLSLPEITLPENGCVNQQVKYREAARHRCIIRAFFDDNGKLRPLCLKMLEQAPCVTITAYFLRFLIVHLFARILLITSLRYREFQFLHNCI